MTSPEPPPGPVGTTLVVGASGVLGSMVARNQLAAGKRVRVFGRDLSRLAALRRIGAEAVAGDIADRDAVAAACRGAERVFTSAHGFASTGRHGSRDTDLIGNRNLVEIAAGTGVRHFVFTSVCIHDDMTAIDFMAHKRATEDTLRSSGLSYTILKPTVLMDTWAWIPGDALLAGRPVQIYGDGRKPVNFVAASDVAEIAAIALARDTPAREEIEIGGPEDLSQLQVLAIFERALGREARKKHFSALRLRVMSLLARPFRPALARQLATAYFMARSPQGLQGVSTAHGYPLPGTRFAHWVHSQWLPRVTAGGRAPDAGGMPS